ncbi:prepilin-type N-terminal cleavage/methylation domain-containing protein [Allofrancisella guangzhouensis]|uniref:Type IV pili fiber building block protein n=1 Tax=Allofrancisella guangzhouensis TaxID=594679 RepID=A0A0A8E5K7_9GAMM|nr:prepilin-type N-terminal cleavage/methylation domain-containing protein [Allofrancisella guangzhouensis]AJC49244.1 type IV pili fiber building block protein [Allofrancisella guangzhouensis]MBK2027686.1 prepilin-type N-terminal cleavage/methylation domain-containing protein [Allofrancisella guangzhouensis]MBK2044900.1 prepilin-type N-terminal cleavage/methylation domain-containing protein [Allofrancisella guangzhouensis]MBK2046425.1 prepilin-type N-terminal cleavage/methylation domain-contain
MSGCVKNKGFSLVEVMVVIAIMTILMMAAISTFTFYYKTFAETRLTNLQKLIEYSVIRARIDGKAVIVCAANADSFDATGKLDETTLNCASTNNWGDNPIVAFESTDGTATYVANDDQIIANLPKGHSEHIYINLSGNPSYLKISPNGFMATGNGNITYCDRSSEYRAALVLNIVGRVVYTDSPTKSGGGLYTCA